MIEIHDSVIESLVHEERMIVLKLSHAYIHESDGRPGIDPGTGWGQRAAISIRGEIVAGGLSELPCDLSSGSLTLGGGKSDNSIPAPLNIKSEIDLFLVSALGESITIRGSEIVLELIGEAEYIEEFPGASWR
jgi:hypothetical protein